MVIAGCAGVPFQLLGRCAPAAEHEATWRDMVFQIVRRARNVRHWELGNEPDDPQTFIGAASDYARWASLAADGIRAARPKARIALGGFSRLDRRFIGAAMRDPAYPLAGRFDIANVHVRVPLPSLPAAVGRARAFYRRLGFDGRLWVTESGYPSLPEHQWDPAMPGGDADQARWMARGPRQLIAGGADVVFVAFRDNPEFGADSSFGSEGVIAWPSLRPRPSSLPTGRCSARRAAATGCVTARARSRARRPAARARRACGSAASRRSRTARRGRAGGS